jgi:preprotein translocase subunit SecE
MAKSAAKLRIVTFAQETAREISKVTWPSQREVTMTTVMIVAMALISGLFFFVVDSGVGFAVSKILGMRS